VPKNSAHQFLSFKDSDKKEIVQFEFVEVPPAPAAQKPQKTRKIAAHDALAQDSSQGTKKDTAPKVRNPGFSDQLAQRPSQSTGLSHRMTGRPSKGAPGEQTPRPEPPGLSGQGKILTQETSRVKSKGARLFGVTSFEATGSGMGIYMKHLKEKIWANWFPYVAFKFPRDFRGADAVIQFTLDAKGRVKSTKVVESKGTPIFAAFCVEAIERTRNFGPLPKEILALTGKDELEISFGFHYG